MNRENTLGIILIALLLGGLILLTRRPAATSNHVSSPPEQYSQGNIKFIPAQEEAPRYRNKETRRIEYNADGLPSLIEITRDYAIT